MQIIRIYYICAARQARPPEFRRQGNAAGGIIGTLFERPSLTWLRLIVGDPPAVRAHEMPENPELIDVERVLMDRARRHAARDGEPAERPVLPRILALAAALVVVVIVLFAFDRFLASMQRFLDLPVGDPAPAAGQAMPAYVVPDAGEPSQVEAPTTAIPAPSSRGDTVATAPVAIEPRPPEAPEPAATSDPPR